MDKSSKQRRTVHDDRSDLVALHRYSYVSSRALTSVLKHIRDHGLPEAVSVRSQRRAHDDIVNEKTPVGPVLRNLASPLNDGSTLQVGVQSPMAMLYVLTRKCKEFRSFMCNRLRQFPPSMVAPWRIIIYFDGISPSDPLTKGKDRRAVEAMYWSFLEFAPFLYMEDLWFCCSGTRHDVVTRIKGGMSQHIEIILAELFFDATHSFRVHGLILDLSDAGDDSHLVTLWADHAITIADEVALKDFLQFKGHGGTKPCPICRDFVHHNTDYADFDATGALLRTTELDITKSRAHTDASVRNMIVYLGGVPAGKQKESCQLLGWNYSQYNVILSERLNYKAMSTLCFDWMHIWCVDGIFGREVRALVDATSKDKSLKIGYAALHNYTTTWKWPRQHAGAERIFEQGKFSATASQSLACAPVLAKYAREVIAPLAHEHVSIVVRSFILCCDALELLVGAARGYVSSDELKATVHEFLKTHLDAHGSTVWAFKHHMSLHIANMFFGLVYC